MYLQSLRWVHVFIPFLLFDLYIASIGNEFGSVIKIFQFFQLHSSVLAIRSAKAYLSWLFSLFLLLLICVFYTDSMCNEKLLLVTDPWGCYNDPRSNSGFTAQKEQRCDGFVYKLAYFVNIISDFCILALQFVFLHFFLVSFSDLVLGRLVMCLASMCLQLEKILS